MIISKTPLRISFLGGGTDYPDYFRQHGGITLATSIDKHSYITVQSLRDLFDFRIRVSYSKTELVNTVDDIEHPSVRECLRFLGIDGGIEIHYIGDLPARTGMGSSSSFTVGLLHALHAYKGELVSRTRLAEEAVHVEQQMIHERVGCQDQYSCALGGLRVFRFCRDGSIEHEPVPISQDRIEALQQRLMLFYTGISRHAHAVLEEQMDRTREGTIRAELRELADLVPQAVEVFGSGADLRRFGELLHEGWRLKCRLSSRISNGLINDAYTCAIQAGAVGGKLLGAGGGGFLVFYVEPDRQGAVRTALHGLREVPFRFDRQGSTLLFYDS